MLLLAVVFGALHRFDSSLPIMTKSIVYQAVVMGVLLYEVETFIGSFPSLLFEENFGYF